jgi:hypothetical protein
MRTKAARGIIMAMKRARTRAARGMGTVMKMARARATRGMATAIRVEGDDKGDGDSNEEGNGDRR